MFYTYVLLGEKTDKNSEFYIGYCIDLKQRFYEHFHKQVKTTQKFAKISLVYYEACLNKTDARKRELQLKTGFGRAYLKRRLVSYLTSGIS